MNSSSAFQITELNTSPDCLALHALNSARYPHFLNSAAQNLSEEDSHKNRYDILFAFPEQSLVLTRQALTKPLDLNTKANDFLAVLNTWYAKEHVSYKTELPFTGGWFIFLAYELAADIEPSLLLPDDSSGLPVAVATRVRSAVIKDHLTGSSYFVSENGVDHQDRLDTLLVDNDRSHSVSPVSFSVNTFEEEPDIHLHNLEKIHQYIVDGDIFQANLSRLWRVELDTAINDASIYQSLRKNNPAPFACLCHFSEGSIISSSPERLVSVKNKRVDTRPIAGTRPRGENAASDENMLNELISHPKERAEHIMLLDLERNDLGRVCEPGSIHVDELMTIETYQHVHHIVSNVTGQIKQEMTPVDVIRAVFPGGTITGCPKVRCMEILTELEQTGRGAYTGSAGYLNRNGDMDLNILIRTLVKKGRHIQFRAGGGIVVDSQPDRELAETRAKAKGMINALNMSKA